MPIQAIHPGEHLAEELQTLDLSAAELARKIAVPTNRVTQILNGGWHIVKSQKTFRGGLPFAVLFRAKGGPLVCTDD